MTFMKTSLKAPQKRNNIHTPVLNTGGIMVFTERPSAERAGSSAKSPEKTKLQAADLFSLFTADIIKQEVLFTR
jgi:hypothetical protein